MIPFQVAEISMRVTREAIFQYAALTNDFNPIHTDPDFAAATPMGGVIAHGTMSLNLLWEALTKTLGRDALEGTVLDVRFIRPVREQDVVTAGGKLRHENAKEYCVWVKNQKGETVIEGTAHLDAVPRVDPTAVSQS